MKGIAMAMRTVLSGALTIGITLAAACSSHDQPNEPARNLGRLSIPLVTTAGGTTYRLDAVFVINGAETSLTLVTTAADSVLTTTLATGSYVASLQYFTLYSQDGTGTLHPVSATPVSTDESFTVFADSTTTVNFQFETQGGVVSVGSGTVDLTFGVTETGAQCTALGPGCPDGSWCAPSALTGAPTGCVPSGTTPLGAACTSPLDCVAESTCHDFGAGPVCTSLCTPAEFGSSCARGGTCLAAADSSYGLCIPEGVCNPITVDPVARTVQSRRFFLDFSNIVSINPEDLDVLSWAGGPNLAQSFASDACTSGVVEYFGNSWAPPDPTQGGKVLVGSGSTGSWEQDGASILIRSTSTGCDASAGVPVETRYTFRDGNGADTIEVERQFDLASVPMNQSFRPYIPRMTNGFDRVLHPDGTNSTLVTESIFDCPNGCARSNWDGSWFAYYASSGSLAGQGVIVLRQPTAVPAQLWIDNDAGITDTNASSVLLVPPPGGFPGPITEQELLCFFDAGTWTPAQQAALTLPEGCTLGLSCNGGGSGPPPDEHPHIVDVQIDPGTTITTCETATLTASVSNPSNKPFTYGWAEYFNNRAPLTTNDNQAVFGPGLAGDYFLSAWLAEPNGVFATFTVPTIHVTLDPACPPVVPDLATLSQLYCAGACGSEGYGCHQEDADHLCRLRTGDPNATAQSFRITTALPEPGVCCSPYPTGTNGCVNIGPQPGIPFDVDVISWSLLDSHGPGDVVTDVVCQP